MPSEPIQSALAGLLRTRLRACLAPSLAILALLLAACATEPEYIEVRPECSCPDMPALPAVSGEALACVPDDAYWDLEAREKRLVDWGTELKAICEQACQSSD